MIITIVFVFPQIEFGPLNYVERLSKRHNWSKLILMKAPNTSVIILINNLIFNNQIFIYCRVMFFKS